jgi:hypothetical protein
MALVSLAGLAVESRRGLAELSDKLTARRVDCLPPVDKVAYRQSTR